MKRLLFVAVLTLASTVHVHAQGQTVRNVANRSIPRDLVAKAELHCREVIVRLGVRH